jgi:activator of 2-hydroxyglutaryl-CoA dehydratase
MPGHYLGVDIGGEDIKVITSSAEGKVVDVIVPDNPQMITAFGAAVMAKKSAGAKTIKH